MTTLPPYRLYIPPRETMSNLGQRTRQLLKQAHAACTYTELLAETALELRIQAVCLQLRAKDLARDRPIRLLIDRRKRTR